MKDDYGNYRCILNCFIFEVKISNFNSEFSSNEYRYTMDPPMKGGGYAGETASIALGCNISF